ncbi:MAG: MBL fold metallo-hydrolase [Candidatus Didemnitutus sp.]|nr:MBL fold metallo-hydrolase [Candidatus Didemnitutus sp.]
MGATPRFPVSDHCDGARFFNPPGQPQARSFFALPRWWWEQNFLRRGTPWPRQLPAPPKPVWPSTVAPESVAVTFIGHATFLLQFAGVTVLTDPVFSQCVGPFGRLGPRRVRPAALALAELPAIDIVLVTHNHYDHLDLPSLRWLARERRPLLVTTLGNQRWLEKRGVGNVVELDWWQAHACGAAADLEITCTPAQHFAARSPWDRCRSLWGGFHLRTPRGAVYFCGDSGWGPHFAEIRARLGAPALALLPVGAYEPRWFMAPVHVNPEEAVRAHLALGARRSMGMHFGAFQLTDEGIDAPVRDLAIARDKYGVGAEEFATLDGGETSVTPLASGGVSGV